MDKTAIKNFSIWARNKLIADITYKAGLLGVTEEGIKDALPQSTKDAEFYDIGTKEPYSIHGEEIKQRKELASAIKRKAAQLDYKEAYRSVIEEVAYTWFNRLIAIRFMEVNDYMPSHIRVLSSEGGKKLEPDLVTTPFDAEIDFTTEENEAIMQMKNDNQVDTLFRFLFIKQCNALNEYLPKLFEKTSDYTELLLNISATDQDGIVYHLTHDIKEDDFNISNVGEDGKPTGQVEIIGWMYQYYNTEPKDEAFALLKSNVKISKERIPAATQLFTPDWIVRYMVENSVGRLWLEGHENEALKSEWKYYLDEAEQESDVIEQLKVIRDGYKDIKPEEIKVIDPCMGSGHILVYAFDVLMQIYESYGYSQRDASKSIVENNIYGLDIDNRAFQLAYFAIMMKARSYNRRFLTLDIEPNLCAVQESNGLEYDHDLGNFLLSEEYRETLKYLLHTFVDAKEYGSIIEVEKRDYDSFLREWQLTAEQTAGDIPMLLWYTELNSIIPFLVTQAKVLSQKYDVVVTNPPYMGSGGMNKKLTAFVKKNFNNEKADLFACFISKGNRMCKRAGYNCMVTMQSWMFLSTFSKMREELLLKYTISNLMHMENMVMGIAFGTAVSIFRNISIENYKGTYNQVKIKNIVGDKPETFPISENRFAQMSQDKFKLLPNLTVAYWLSNAMIEPFQKGVLLRNISEPKCGLSTTDNNRFLRFWFEPSIEKIEFAKKPNEESSKKFFPYSKGGDFRRWYGNRQFVVNWENDGSEIKEAAKGASGGRIVNPQLYFHPFITWSKITSGLFSMRKFEVGTIFSDAGGCIFSVDNDYLLGFTNSKICQTYLDVLNPTVNYQVGNIGDLPIIFDMDKKEMIEQLVRRNVELSKKDWDSYETSWDYMCDPLIEIRRKNPLADMKIEECYKELEKRNQDAIKEMKENEEKINEIFIKMYGLECEMQPEVEDKDISLSKVTLKGAIKNIVSYAIGCIFGRYSFERNGVLFAGNQFDESNYYKILPDKDNIIPITDESYFSDDMTDIVCNWFKVAFGNENYEENISFVADALGNKGDTPISVIRSYLVNNFFVDHCAMYSTASSGKRPIYWLFDSGKQNGFKALIYMHRYNADTIGNLRVDYLHRMERIYESEINRMQDSIDNSSNAREVTAASKRKEKLQKQLKECQEYDAKIGHLALSRIEINLDDGVKVNYEKIQTASDGKKYQVLAKI